MALCRREFLAGSLALSISRRAETLSSTLGLTLSNNAAKPISTVKVGTPVKLSDNQGDTWASAWADDGKLYSPSDDTSGFNKSCNSNVAFNRLDGNDPLRLTGATINPMTDYGTAAFKGPDGCSWKSTGCIFIDGALYLAIARHKYGEDSGDPKRRQTAQNSSIIRSTDLGKTWKRPAQQNYDAPMFPGRRFATPYFIQYGYGHGKVTADGGDRYVYATSNNGFWDCGDDMVLGRVARAKLSGLNGKDWEYFVGGDGSKPAAWSSQVDDARLLIDTPGKFGMTGPVYLASLRRYFMIAWYYPAGGGKMPGAGTHSVWDFYESPLPWGPWNRIGSYESTPAGLYTPEICPKFQDRNRVFALSAGYWENPEVYRLTIVPLELQS
jgi:hypothetical protein